MLRTTPMLLAAGLLGCKSCAGCFHPEQPTKPNEHHGETDEPLDTEDTSPVVDTAPPPPCAVPETEPNNSLGDANAVPLEQQACGDFLDAGDGDWLVFPGEDADWLRVEVDAASRGSRASVAFSLMARASGELTLKTSDAFVEDPWILFPALGDEEYHLYLTEADALSGDDYGWWLLVSEDKAPVGWTREEVEANNTAAQAETVEPGDVIFGRISSSYDYDWYHLQVPASEAGITWTFTVEAYSSGSPLAARMSLYGPEVVGADIDDVPYLKSVFHDSTVADRDPVIEWPSRDATDWYLLVKMTREESEANPGSAFHWYTLSIDNDE
ncbi:MAG: hypothetical protein ABIO70_31670 [Pseudomonadota bacterium]